MCRAGVAAGCRPLGGSRRSCDPERNDLLISAFCGGFLTFSGTGQTAGDGTGSRFLVHGPCRFPRTRLPYDPLPPGLTRRQSVASSRYPPARLCEAISPRNWVAVRNRTIVAGSGRFAGARCIPSPGQVGSAPTTRMIGVESVRVSPRIRCPLDKGLPTDGVPSGFLAREGHVPRVMTRIDSARRRLLRTPRPVSRVKDGTGRPGPSSRGDRPDR